jgi:hypothetical protein
MAENRYQELLPLLSRLNELETDQKQDEKFYEKKDKGGNKQQTVQKQKGKNDQANQKKGGKKK